MAIRDVKAFADLISSIHQAVDNAASEKHSLEMERLALDLEKLQIHVERKHATEVDELKSRHSEAMAGIKQKQIKAIADLNAKHREAISDLEKENAELKWKIANLELSRYQMRSFFLIWVYGLRSLPIFITVLVAGMERRRSMSRCKIMRGKVGFVGRASMATRNILNSLKDHRLSARHIAGGGGIHNSTPSAGGDSPRSTVAG